MKNIINKKGQKHGIWQHYNEAKALFIEENYKNGVLYGKHAEIYKGNWFREQFYKNGQLFGETLRNDKLLIKEFHELIDDSEWKIDEEKYPHEKFLFVDGKCMFEYSYKNEENSGVLWVRYCDFWSVFALGFGMDYQEIRDFIQQQVEKHFKMKVDTTLDFFLHIDRKVEKHFKWKAAYEKRKENKGIWLMADS